MASRLRKHLLRTKSKAEKFGLYALYPCFLFICCLVAQWLIFGYCWRNSLTHLMLIIAFGRSIFGRKVTGRSSVSTSNWVPNGFSSQWHNPLTHSSQIAKNALPKLAPSFSKMWKYHQCSQCLQNSLSLRLEWPLGLQNTSLDANFSVQNFSFCGSVKSMS